jgi:hypothetical protein
MGLVLFMKVKFLEKISYSTNVLNAYTMAISITFVYLQVSSKLIEEI